MSKVICDICGTSYPDTASQCPICGCVRSADTAAISSSEERTGEYTYVKGGRFSKSNVRKRNQAALKTSGEEKKDPNKKMMGLIIVLVSLILIVALMIVFVISDITKRRDEITQNETTEYTTEPCTGLRLSQIDIVMNAVGEVWLLEATPTPATTTDEIIFSSDNTEVATVSASGQITCIGAGQAVITVTCGDQTAECRVKCVIEEEETTELPTVAPVQIHLNRTSMTLSIAGVKWTLYSGDIAVEDITWTSDDPAVATFENGVVTAIAEGVTNVHATYNGITTSCEVICKFEDPTAENSEGNGENPDETTATVVGELELYTQYGNKIPYNEDLKAYDVTVAVGSKVGLILKDASGNAVTLDWTVTTGTSCTVEGNYVKVENSTENCMVTAEYNGVTYSCYIRTVN